MTSSPVEVVTIPGAGHAAHLERPREWTAAVTAFLDHRHAS
jgi:pimeloyl-ACP methyl ester carboxylesterase